MKEDCKIWDLQLGKWGAYCGNEGTLKGAYLRRHHHQHSVQESGNWVGFTWDDLTGEIRWKRLLLLLFSHLVGPNFLWSQGLHHSRLPCPSPSPKVHPSSCQLHQWCHLAMSSYNTVFTFCPQSVPASGSFPMSQLFTSDDRNTGASASASVLPMNIQDCLHLRLINLILLLSEGLSDVFSITTVWRHQFFGVLPSFMVQLWQPYMTTGKTIALTLGTFVGRVMSLLFNTLSTFVIAFLPRSNHLLSSWLHSPSAVILEPKKRKYVSISSFSPFICHEVMVPDAMILVFSIFSFQPAPSPSSWGSLVPLHFCH